MPLLAAALFASLAAAAFAAHWAQYGGDGGRSGYQPLNEPALPLPFEYAKTQDSEKNIRTSVITTAGGSTGEPRMAYGTQNPDPARARIHLQKLADGTPVGPESGVNIDNVGLDGDTFGSGIGSVTPVDTSSATNFGNLFAIHNDDNQNIPNGVSGTDPRKGADVALAQIRTISGNLGTSIGDIALGDQVDPTKPDTIAYTVQSSPLFTGTGTERTIFFTGRRTPSTVNDVPQEFPCDASAGFETVAVPGVEATRGCVVSEERSLFKVVISEALTENAQIVSFNQVVVGNTLNHFASPTLVNLDRDGAGPNPAEPHIAVTTTDGFVRTFKAADLTVGPASADLGDQAETVSVPVNSDGSIPATAPALFVAVREAGTGAGLEDTIVHRLTLNAGGTAFESDPATGGRSFDLLGNPSPGLTVTKEADVPAKPGRVVVLTTFGVFSLNADNLREGTARIPATAPGHTKVVPAASGDLVFWTEDNGDQHVANSTSLDEAPNTAAGFQENGANDIAAGNGSFGQPSVAFRFLQFASDNGAFVYKGSLFVPAPGSLGVSVSDVTVKEGDSGTSVATFTLTKTGTNAASVKVQTADGTAKAGEDYVAVAARTVEFGDTETTKTVDVTINGDTTFESDEFFKLQLSEPSNGVIITDSEGAGIIQNDDPLPPGEQPPAEKVSEAVLIISDQVVTEGDFGDVLAVFSVGLTSPSKETVTVRYGTASRTAVGGSDFTSVSGALTFAPGEQVKQFAVPVKPDGLVEPTEQFFVGIADAKGAAVADPVGVGTIIDDDGAPAAPFAKAPTISLSVNPKRDKRKPYRFTSTGRLRIPAGVSQTKGCQGRVAVQVKSVRKTISTRRVNLSSTCRYRLRVTFKNAKRFSKSGVLSFRARYQGTPFLKAAKSKEIKVRTTR